MLSNVLLFVEFETQYWHIVLGRNYLFQTTLSILLLETRIQDAQSSPQVTMRVIELVRIEICLHSSFRRCRTDLALSDGADMYH